MEVEVEDKYLNELASACTTWDGESEFRAVEIPQAMLDKYKESEEL